MEPINELSTNLTTLLQEIAEKQCDLDLQGQKILLEALRKLLIATEKLNVQLHTLARNPPTPARQSLRQRPALYLVK
jgi:hypothetical protein